MFRKKVVTAFSIVAIVLSAVGLLLSILATLIIQRGSASLAFFLGIVSWSILLWASIIGFQLCSSYKLYDDEYKKVGLRIYTIIIAFILFFFVGLVAGLAISVILLSTLWALKRNYDEWESSDNFLPDANTHESGDTNTGS
jgi:hypothetical protein